MLLLVWFYLYHDVATSKFSMNNLDGLLSNLVGIWRHFNSITYNRVFWIETMLLIIRFYEPKLLWLGMWKSPHCPLRARKQKLLPTSTSTYSEVKIHLNNFCCSSSFVLVWDQQRPKLWANQFTSSTCVQSTITFRILKILRVYLMCNKKEVALLVGYFHTTLSVVLTQFVSLKISLKTSANLHFQICITSSSHTTVLIISAFTDWIDGAKIVLLVEPIEVFSKAQKSRRSRHVYFIISTYLCVGNILIASRNPLANGLLSIFRRVICK